MRKKLWLTPVLTLSAFATVLYGAEEKKGNAEPSPKFEQGVVVGNRLIGIDNRGHLVAQDLVWLGGRDYGTLDRELGKYIDVAKDKACVTTPNAICEVDLSSGKVVRSAKHTTGTGGVGFIDANRVFAHNGLTLEIIDMASGKTLQKIELVEGKRSANWFNGKPLIAHSRSENLLYVAQPFQRDIAVVDLGRGELVKQIEMTDFPWTIGVHVAGNKLFARQMMVSYGFVQEHLTVVDLTTGKNQRIQFPKEPSDRAPRLHRDGSTHSPLEIIPSGKGGFFLSAQEGVYQYNPNGQLVGKSPQALKDGQRVVAARHGRPVVANTESVYVIEMSPAKIAAK